MPKARLLSAPLLALALLASGTRAQESLPRPEPPFRGVVKRTLAGSKPDTPRPVAAPAGAPNVLPVLIDDAGFGNPSTFGGPVRTPTLDRLAEVGLRYNAFHVTALCSPTRAALLSGRNHHSIGFGSVTEVHSGYPGYDAEWPRSAASIAEILRDNGYSTAAFGKWHLTPDDQQGPAGPFDRWPNALGFDYFWGFLGGESSHYDPLLVENNTILGVPTEKGFYLTTAMADRAIRWIRARQAQAPARPFFVYFATGASHAPHHVPKEWSRRYAGSFDAGWDALREQTFLRQKQLGVVPADARLTPRPDAFPAWDSVPPEVKKLYAHQMEVYAGFQEATDHEVGRVIQAISDLGLGDDALVFYIFGDNGASMEGTETGSFNELTALNGIPLTTAQQLEAIKAYGGLKEWGGPRTEPHYAAAWAWAGNTPFQWGKQVASHLGGIRDGMVVSWPKRIADQGGVRSQFTHAIDLAPTLLEVTGIPAPAQVDGIAQIPMQGTSFAYSFADASAPDRHTRQYFEIIGNRAMYEDGWLWSCRIDRIPWKFDPATLARLAPGKWNPDDDRCELYDLAHDFSQSRDVSAQEPARMQAMKSLFWGEAAKYQVLPLFGGIAGIWGIQAPGALAPRTVVLYPGVENLAQGMIPPIYNRTYSIEAVLDVDHNRCMLEFCSGAEGVIVANASFLGGFSLYVRGGKLRYTYSLLGLKIDDLVAEDPLP